MNAIAVAIRTVYEESGPTGHDSIAVAEDEDEDIDTRILMVHWHIVPTHCTRMIRGLRTGSDAECVCILDCQW